MVIENVGENLRLLREKTGFSQANIAVFLGVDQSTVSKIEKGQRGLTADMLEKLATLYGIFGDEMNKKDLNPAISFAFRGSELSQKDMETLCAINKIALNSEFMAKLSGESENAE